MQLHHLKAGEICFEKSEVLSSFINDVSKSRNRDFCLRKSVEGAGGGRVGHHRGHHAISKYNRVYSCCLIEEVGILVPQ